jgi:two-component system chemotaxis response regulator CheY
MTSVIVIDDNKDIVNSMSELLEIYGLDVVGKGYNGLEGVDLYKKLQPDAILLDLMMPEYDGLYALKEIRKINPKSVILIVTGGASPSINDGLKTLQPTKIIHKPIDVNSLVEIILEETTSTMPFKIQYVFKNDPKSYTCVMTNDQYKNFKGLPVLQEYKILKNDEKNIEAYEQEMQKALNLAAENDLTHIQKLSQLV